MSTIIPLIQAIHRAYGLRRAHSKIHQKILQRALTGRATPEQLRIMMQEQGDFDKATQDEASAYKHAMRARWETPEAARKKANWFIRYNICNARRLAASGRMPEAMRLLSRAIHTLQDSTSPAHANFAVAWDNTTVQTINHLPHYVTENFDPGSGSVADEVTLEAWMYFTGERQMPDDFFGDVFDVNRYGRGYFRGKAAPDGGSCDCDMQP